MTLLLSFSSPEGSPTFFLSLKTLEPCHTIVIKQDNEQTKNLLSGFISLMTLFETVALYLTQENKHIR